MGLHTTAKTIASTHTGEHALAAPDGTWRLSWARGSYSRDEAMQAVKAAELVARGHSSDPRVNAARWMIRSRVEASDVAAWDAYLEGGAD